MNFETLKNTWNGWSKKKKIIAAFFVLVILGSLAPKKDKNNTQDAPPPVATTTQETPSSSAQVEAPPPSEPVKQWVSAEGLTESQWIARCQRYENAKQACAVADRPGQCMGIKLGDVDKGMGDMYCENGQPNWFLMGRR